MKLVRIYICLIIIAFLGFITHIRLQIVEFMNIDQVSKTYSYVEFFTPTLAQDGTEEMLRMASKIVKMNNTMWDGKKFIIFNDSHDREITLTTKLISNWYYKTWSKKMYPVYGQYLKKTFNTSNCTGGIIEGTTVLLEGNWCDNHWHAIHDNIMPLMSTLGNKNMDQWDPASVNILYYKHKCNSILFTREITTNPVRLLKEIKPNTCFKSLQLNGDQKLNMYIKPTKERCERFRKWIDIYTQNYDQIVPKTNKTIIRWIARTGSREVKNRVQVVKYIKQSIPNIDIKIVKLEKMKVEEQINIFRHSDVIIGPHGAGLAKVMFMKPGSIFFQLMPFGMGTDQVSAIWIFNDGTKFYKGDNFYNSALCAGVKYLQYDTSFNESGWSEYDRKKLPNGFMTPKQFWGNPVHISSYVSERNTKVQSGIANSWYVAKRNSYFRVDPKIITKKLLENL